MNDLKLAVEATRVLGLPFGMVINRCDAGTDETEKYAEREGIPVLLKIPDRRDIAENYSRGVLMTQAIPEIKQQFRQLMADIEKKLS